MIEVKKTNEGQVHIRIPEMPWWSGPQKKRTSPRLMPFCLQSKLGEPITQFLDENEKAEVVKIYNETAYEFITAPPGKSEWANRLALENVSKFEDLVQIKKSTKILEIGAGSTWIANFLRKKYSCTNYTCVDPAVKTDNLDFPNIISDYFPTKQLAKQKFDLILAFNVLEHAEKTISFLKSVRSALKDEGTAVICVPDCTKQFLLGDINSLIHEHLVYFTNTSIAGTLKRCGLKAIKSISENDLFTIIVHKIALDSNGIGSIDESEYLLKLGSSLTSLFEDFAGGLKAKLSDGMRVGFHGATQGLNTFLHVGGFKDHNFHIFDGDVRKHGLFMPSVNKKIESTNVVEYQNVDVMIISALSFEDEIRRFIERKTNIPKKRVISLCANSSSLISQI